jgi:hypothetical protein
VGAAAAEELVDALADVLVEAVAEDEDELLDELHAAAVSPRNVIPMTTALRRRDERKVSIPRR